MRIPVIALCMLLPLAFPAQSWAQSGPMAQSAPYGQGFTGNAAAQEPRDNPNAAEPWFEDETTTYKFIGLRTRIVYVPQFMFGVYSADGGKAVTAPVIGLEYGIRRAGFEYDLWLTYSSYGMDEVPFKSKSDPDTSWELVRSELKTIQAGVDFLWSADTGKGTSFLYGGGVGLGAVFGDLYRNQIYPGLGASIGDPSTYSKCTSPGVPNGPYCQHDNDHYGSYSEPSWVNGGQKPIVFPWIALPQIGFRWKASEKFVLRFDTGLSFPGPFFFGIGGQYGLL